ncbi:MAG: FAD-binding oxidoreductase [Planctomycetota bacterium]
MSVSYWKRSLAKERLATVDVCVVGAGIAGLSAADELAQRGKSVVVVEQHGIGWGASSRNAGYIMRGTAESYAEITDTLGRDIARRVWADSERNHALLRERFGADTLSSYQRVNSELIALSERDFDLLGRSSEMLDEDGFDAPISYGSEAGDDALHRSLKPLASLTNPGDAAVNPAELISCVNETVGERASIFESTEVFGLDHAGNGVRVRTSRGEVEAERVLVCTNAYAGSLLPSLAERVVPNRGQMLAIHAPDVRLDASYYVDGGSEYIRQARDGTIVVGGMRKHFEAAERTSSDEPTAEVQAALEDFAERAVGTRGTVVARWAGTMGFTADGLPIVEPIDVDGIDVGRVWFCGGFTGHGMSLGVVTAHEAVRQMLDQA